MKKKTPEQYRQEAEALLKASARETRSDRKANLLQEAQVLATLANGFPPAVPKKPTPKATPKRKTTRTTTPDGAEVEER